jgi:peptidoglycan/xylan/chitin deacetylase (PgdA/CDA1 family)
MVRLDRFLTLALFSHVNSVTKQKGLQIPILMYHSISCNAENNVHPYYRVVTSPQVFAAHMQHLHDGGYRVISIDDAIGLLSSDKDFRRPDTGRFAVITFDDGLIDFYTEAFPILKNSGYTATVFLPTSFITDTNTTISGQTFMSWPQVRELVKAGISFGSHSVTHRLLAGLSKEEIDQELQVSREAIEQKTGCAVRIFSYPYAFPENDREFVSSMRAKMEANGYLGAVTTRIGTASQGDDLFCLKRIPVNDADDIPFFRAKLAGSYDWLHSAQYLAKSVKGMLGIKRRKSLAKWSTPYS